MKILAIDTSCDETSVAVSHNDSLKANIISSQIEFHTKWGGVVPLIAQRNHQEKIDIVIKKALQVAKVNIEDIDIFAVTYGPGLAVALEVGIKKIKQLAKKHRKPVVAVDHMAGHLYANFARNRNSVPLNPILFTKDQSLVRKDIFPFLGLLISGGHTEIILIEDHLKFSKIGETLDDSIGEAFDKVANMLGLGYPGGPIIEELATQGDEHRFDLPIAMKNSNDLNFSYSGLKTAVLRVIKELGTEAPRYDPQEKEGIPEPSLCIPNLYQPTLSKKPIYKLNKQDILDVAASFQCVAYKQLKNKLLKAIARYKTEFVVIGGGVVANLYIRRKLRKTLGREGVRLIHPQNKKLVSDNAGMIAVSAYYQALDAQFVDIEELDRKPRLSL